MNGYHRGVHRFPKSFWLLFPIRCNYHEQPHSKVPLTKDEHPREVKLSKSYSSGGWDSECFMKQTPAWVIYKIPKFGTQLTPPFYGKKNTQPEVHGGVKIRPWSKNTNPLGSIFRSQERSDPGIGALAALFEVSKGRAQEVAGTGEVLFFCWPWQNSTKFVLKALKKKGWVISFCFQYWWWCGIFFGSKLWDSEVCSFPLWNLRY